MTGARDEPTRATPPARCRIALRGTISTLSVLEIHLCTAPLRPRACRTEDRQDSRKILFISSPSFVRMDVIHPCVRARRAVEPSATECKSRLFSYEWPPGSARRHVQT